MTTPSGGESGRVAAARARVADAEDACAAAHDRAERARRARTLRLHRIHPGVAFGSIVVTVASVVVAVILVALADDRSADTDRADAVVDAARAAIVTTLTADPAHPHRYLDSVLAVSVGEFRTRIESSESEIRASVAAQSVPAVGQVVSAGILVGDDPAPGVEVLVVAEATNPQLVGGGAGDARVVLLVGMSKAGGSWKIERAQLQ